MTSLNRGRLPCETPGCHSPFAVVNFKVRHEDLDLCKEHAHMKFLQWLTAAGTFQEILKAEWRQIR
jgi:hypothetical protein